MDAQESSKRVSDRNLFFNLKKKDETAEFWPRLTKEKIKVILPELTWLRGRNLDVFSAVADNSVSWLALVAVAMAEGGL